MQSGNVQNPNPVPEGSASYHSCSLDRDCTSGFTGHMKMLKKTEFSNQQVVHM